MDKPMMVESPPHATADEITDELNADPQLVELQPQWAELQGERERLQQELAAKEAELLKAAGAKSAGQISYLEYQQVEREVEPAKDSLTGNTQAIRALKIRMHRATVAACDARLAATPPAVALWNARNATLSSVRSRAVDELRRLGQDIYVLEKSQDADQYVRRQRQAKAALAAEGEENLRIRRQAYPVRPLV